MDEPPKERLPDESFVVRVVTITLAAVIIAVVCTLMVGLFTPQVDNADVFKVIAPAFQTTIGTFGGFLGGLAVGKMRKPPSDG